MIRPKPVGQAYRAVNCADCGFNETEDRLYNQPGHKRRHICGFCWNQLLDLGMLDPAKYARAPA